MNREITPDLAVFNLAQAATYLGVGPRIIRRLLGAGKIPYRQIDGRGTIRIHRDCLDAYVKGTEVAR